MPRLIIHTDINRRDIEIQPRESLLHALQRGGISISFPCAGNHTCGKCRVRAQGALSPMKDEERALLKDAEEGIRLACFTQAEGDCAVYLTRGSGDTIASNYTADSEAGHPIYRDGFGAAFDIGTTTVVGYLFHESGTEPLAVLGELNRQQPYGSDVLSRIDYCNTHTVQPLCALTRGSCRYAAWPLREGGPAYARSPAIVVTGNTAMMHILAGLEPGSLALAPFTPQSLFDCWLDLGLSDFDSVQTYIPPCISSYVGADITCSILYSGITRKSENLLLVDIGTNGEMALQTPECMVCCATAAGPAFEGAGISCGSNARGGAIQSVWANTEPSGIRQSRRQGREHLRLRTRRCGSGIPLAGQYRPLGRMDKRIREQRA
jgi:uncharacterized 2Fe-2S/4Fe-4S cluster protein (DUF4445 family)